MADNQQKQQNSMAQDASGAINMGRKAAKSAKTVGSAAAQAASGNVAGAAATILKDPETMKKVLLIAMAPILVLLLLMVFFLYCLPMSIYEAVVSFMEYAMETWDEVALSNAYGGNVLINICATASRIAMDGIDVVRNAISSAWTSAKNFFRGDPADSENQTETFSSNGQDLGMIDTEATQRLAIIRKAIAINDKFRIRAEQVADAVVDVNDDVKDWLADKYKHDAENSDYIWVEPGVPSVADITIEDIGICGAEASRLLSTLEDREDDIIHAADTAARETASQNFDTALSTGFDMDENATSISLLSLVMAQYGGNVSDMKLSDLLRCMGYYKNSFGYNTCIDVGHVTPTPITAKVRDWTGSFKPQYAMEEWQYYMNRWDEAKLRGDDTLTDHYRDILDSYEDAGVAMTDLFVVLDYPDLDITGRTYDYMEESHHSTDRSSTDDYWYYYINPYGESVLVQHDHYYSSRTTSRQTRQFTVQGVKVYCKDIGDIASLAGLWNGAFVETEVPTPSPTTTP